MQDLAFVFVEFYQFLLAPFPSLSMSFWPCPGELVHLTCVTYNPNTRTLC